MVIVSLNTGLRKSEQLNLQWRDIDFRQGLLLVRNSKPGDSRYVPMNAAVVQTLKALPRRIHSPFVFAGRKVGAHMKRSPEVLGGISKEGQNRKLSLARSASHVR